MPTSDQAMLTQVFESLRNLRNIINTPCKVEETYIREFHNALKTLESLGWNVNEFYISEGEIKSRLTAITSDGRESYSPEKYVDRDLLLKKLNSLLLSFKLTCEEDKIIISFSNEDLKRGCCG
jgi:hypothetical protein